ncbi:MAG: NAD-dependent epimerase/dehydratase family protein [Patescibacteria group bacterium]
MRILVTGGTGFVGSNLVLQLMKDGHDVLITGSDAEQKIPNFKGKYLQPGFLGLDWKSIGKIDVLFHQAAINDTTNLDKREMFLANVESSKKLFKEVVKNGCKRIIYASSTAAYGDALAPYKEDGPMTPINPYGESKKALDQFATKFAKENPKVIIVGLRYCNIYGPRENHKGPRASIIYQLAQQMTKKDPDIIFWNGEARRDHIYVKDVVRANILAMKAKESCIVNCGTGKSTSYNEIVAVLNFVLETKRKIKYRDNPYADRFQTFTQCDMSLAKEKIGFAPKWDIKKGILDYYKSGFLVN